MRDLRVSLAHAERLGAAMLTGPFGVPGGPILGAVNDPDGNPLVLVQQ